MGVFVLGIVAGVFLAYFAEIVPYLVLWLTTKVAPMSYGQLPPKHMRPGQLGKEYGQQSMLKRFKKAKSKELN